MYVTMSRVILMPALSHQSSKICFLTEQKIGASRSRFKTSCRDSLPALPRPYSCSRNRSASCSNYHPASWLQSTQNRRKSQRGPSGGKRSRRSSASSLMLTRVRAGEYALGTRARLRGGLGSTPAPPRRWTLAGTPLTLGRHARGRALPRALGRGLTPPQTSPLGRSPGAGREGCASAAPAERGSVPLSGYPPAVGRGRPRALFFSSLVPLPLYSCLVSAPLLPRTSRARAQDSRGGAGVNAGWGIGGVLKHSSSPSLLPLAQGRKLLAPSSRLDEVRAKTLP